MASSFPVFHSTSQRGSTKTTHCLIRARLSPLPLGGDFSSAASTMERWDTHLPLHFEHVQWHRGRGQHEAAPFLFISNGGSVTPTCCLHVFSFTPLIWGGFHPCGIDKRGRCETHMPPPFPIVLPPPLQGYFLPAAMTHGGQCETHMLPLFLVLYPPMIGGI